MELVTTAAGLQAPQAPQPVHLAGSVLGASRHVCAFFHRADDQYRTLLPFIKEGLERGEKAVHVVDPRRRADHLARLAVAGIDPTAQAREQLEVRDWCDAHLQGGAFDQDRTLRLMADIRRRSVEQGFTGTRFVTQMEWAIESDTTVEALLEYEACANLQPLDTPVVCAYDLTRFRGDVVVDIMRTHPMVIIGGLLQENPFFVPPQLFLQDLRQRRAR